MHGETGMTSRKHEKASFRGSARGHFQDSPNEFGHAPFTPTWPVVLPS
jgi:hypothetical protein